MKTKMTLATATAALLMVLNIASASEPLLSPKAKVLADSLKKMPGTTVDMIDRSPKNGSPKHIAFVASLRKESGTTPDVTRNLPTSTPRLMGR